MGLFVGRSYEFGIKTLRYGSIMIMTDQDHDGSHIKGLIINFLHHFWPSLLHHNPGFLKEFVTPIIKATKDSNKTSHSFFTIPEYEMWSKKQPNNLSGWRIKYYKGLGTSTSAEAKEYFKAIYQHRIKFKYTGKQDDEAINNAFSKS